jgi:Protein of unknown function (DUF3224)
MSRHAEGSFEVTGWNEDPYLEIDASRKLTRASVTQTFTGDIKGEGSVEWLMCYRPDGTADWMGFQRIVGQVGDRSGSFVLHTDGTFDGSVASGDWPVVAGSGTEELETLRGAGRMHSPLGTTASFVLEYDLD